MSERRDSRGPAETSGQAASSKSERQPQDSGVTLEEAIAAEWGDLLDDAHAAASTSNSRGRMRAADRLTPSEIGEDSPGQAAPSSTGARDRNGSAASQTHVASTKAIFDSAAISRPVMPLLLAPIVSGEAETSDNDFGLPMVTSADLDRLARERESSQTALPTAPGARKRATTLNDLPPVPGMRRTLNRTTPGANGSESAESGVRRPPSGVHATVPGTALHALKPIKTGSYGAVNAPRFSPPTLPTASERPRTPTPLPQAGQRTPTISPLAGLRVGGPSAASSQSTMSMSMSDSAILTPSQSEELSVGESLVEPPPASAGSRTIRTAILAGSLAMTAVILLALPLLRGDEAQDKNAGGKEGTNITEGVLQAGQLPAPTVALPKKVDKAPTVEPAAKPAPAPEQTTSREPALPPSPTVTADNQGVRVPSNPTPSTAPAESANAPGEAAFATSFVKAASDSNGKRRSPSTLAPDRQAAYEAVPLEADDREPVGGVGPSGVHVDKLVFGSDYVDHRCIDPKSELSVAARERAHICARFVHAATREEVTIKWILNGKTIRRKVFTLSPSSHYGGGYMFLPVALEPGWHGKWTIRVEASDGTSLGEVGFTVVD